MFYSRELHEADTPYGHYRVADVYYNGRPARVLYSGNNDAAQSGIALDDEPELLFDYNQKFRQLVHGVQPGNLLHIGGGALTFPTALARDLPDARQDVVELDGDLVYIARRYFGFEDSERVRVHISDGRRFLATAGKKYDAVLIDVFSHATIPPTFQTLEFAQSLKSNLTKNGVVGMNVIASLDGSRSAVLYRLHEIMQAVFLNVQIFPASRGMSPWSSQNFILTAQDGSRDLQTALESPAIKML